MMVIPLMKINGKISNNFSKSMLRKIFFLNIFFIIAITFNSYSFEKEAEQLVQSTTDNAKKIILDSNIKINDKKKKIEAIALDVVDVDGLGRFTLGSSRKDLNETQLKKYTEVFRVFFAKNISSRLQNYSDQNIKVFGSKKISDNYVLVNSKMVSKKDNQEIKIDWRVFNINNKLVIRDLVVEGLSLAKTQREEFSSILASKGFDGLMANLKDFISKN
ncbi:MAG: ABC transporter substrate-binding protein [Pelagibacteraceae bacterium]|nr:ABC transporter substrate-binding protein [Pelagibacteraceae bacterium]MCI5079509.1 ABC transporter substrate-binding protein [Pelagibacteraceae bacterium]